MALNIGELYATLRLKADGANEGLTSFGASAKKMGDSVGKVGASLTKSVTLPILAIGTAVGVGAVKLISFGSDAMEMDSKFKTVFGSMSGEADKWASNFRDKVGGSTVDIKTVMADSMDLMAGMEATGAEGLKMAQNMQSLGTDLASFQNISGGATEATDKLRRGLMGEHENLKSLGIMVNDTTIKQQMAINGDKRKFQSLTELEKMNVRYQIAVKQSGNAIGDAERTSEGYANTVRDLQGRFKDLVTEISIKFMPIAMKIVNYMVDNLLPAITAYILPAIDKFIDGIGKLATWFTNLSGTGKKLIVGFGAFVIAIGPILTIVGSVMGAVGFLSTTLGVLGVALVALSAPVLIIIASFVALGVGLVALYASNENFRNKVKALWENVKVFIKTTVDQIIVLFNVFVGVAKNIWAKHGADIMAVVSKAFDVISAVIKTAMNIITSLIKIATGLIKGDWGMVWSGIKSLTSAVVNGIVAIVRTSFNLLKSIISGVLSGIAGIFSTIWTRIKNTTVSIVNGIKSGIVNAFNSAKNTVISVTSSLYSGAMGKFNALKSGVSGVFNNIKSTVSNSINAVKRVFNALKLNFPKIKLPYFTIKGKFSLKPLSVPHLAIGWKAKGAIFDAPSIVGLAERGREAVVPLEGQAGNVFAQAFLERIQGLGGSFNMGQGITVNVNGDVRNPAQFAKLISREIQLETDRKTRARGR